MDGELLPVVGELRAMCCSVPLFDWTGLQLYGGKPLLEGAASKEGDGFAARAAGRIPRAALA